MAELLKMPGISGHAITRYEQARFISKTGNTIETGVRNWCLKEIFLARALYRCGDHCGLGKQILQEYANDLRGHYARHAMGVLQKGPG
mgnify:FL=1